MTIKTCSCEAYKEIIRGLQAENEQLQKDLEAEKFRIDGKDRQALNSANAEVKALKVERDLAIAHDRQPYPTAYAYEMACKTLEELKAENKRLKASE